MISDDTLRTMLQDHLPEPGAADRAMADPDTDLRRLGLDSISTFALIDDLAAEGVTVEFGDLISNPTVRFLRESSAG